MIAECCKEKLPTHFEQSKSNISLTDHMAHSRAVKVPVGGSSLAKLIQH